MDAMGHLVFPHILGNILVLKFDFGQTNIDWFEIKIIKNIGNGFHVKTSVKCFRGGIDAD